MRVTVVVAALAVAAFAGCATGPDRRFYDGEGLDRMHIYGPAAAAFADAARTPGPYRGAALLRASDAALVDGDARLAMQALRDLADTRSVLADEARRRLGLHPRAASLTVTAHEISAEIIVDGELIGITPLPTIAIAPGTHHISERADGFEPQDVAVVVAEGEAATVTFRPVPRPFRPSAQDVVFAGQCVGSGALGVLLLVLAALVH